MKPIEKTNKPRDVERTSRLDRDRTSEPSIPAELDLPVLLALNRGRWYYEITMVPGPNLPQ